MLFVPYSAPYIKKDLPNLASAKSIAIDTETYDPQLLERGPGWATGNGYVVGVSLAVDGASWYFPIRHQFKREDNYEPEFILSWLQDTLSNTRQTKIGANLTYDVGWLKREGVTVKGHLFDVQFAEALLDEAAKVNLDALANKYLGEGKESNDLYKWCSSVYGGPVDGSQRKNIWRAPASIVEAYAKADAHLPLAIARKQYVLLQQQGLLKVAALENGLINLMVDMRMAGVSVNLQAAEELRKKLIKKEQDLMLEMRTMAGRPFNPNSGVSVASVLRKEEGLADLPSYAEDVLKSLDNPLAKLIVAYRKAFKLRTTFVESYVLEGNHNGKIYTTFNQLRDVAGGTRSGRFSSANPNLQNIPARGEDSKLVRSLFIPDSGHYCWRKYDYSQIEYRFLAHYAEGLGADIIRKAYNDNPNTDYHEAARKLIESKTGMLLSRAHTKTINFGLVYGMGTKKLASTLGLGDNEAKDLFASYHAGLPFVSNTLNKAMRETEATGLAKTFLGRLSRFELWGAKNGRGYEALSKAQAMEKYGNAIKRVATHKALNRILQGSAADLLKTAMLELYESGVLDKVGVPRLTVHDELDFSQVNEDDDYEEVKKILEDSLKLKVPVVVECKTAKNWGEC